jgi:hypothetical protein
VLKGASSARRRSRARSRAGRQRGDLRVVHSEAARPLATRAATGTAAALASARRARHIVAVQRELFSRQRSSPRGARLRNGKGSSVPRVELDSEALGHFSRRLRYQRARLRQRMLHPLVDHSRRELTRAAPTRRLAAAAAVVQRQRRRRRRRRHRHRRGGAAALTKARAPQRGERFCARPARAARRVFAPLVQPSEVRAPQRVWRRSERLHCDRRICCCLGAQCVQQRTARVVGEPARRPGGRR